MKHTGSVLVAAVMAAAIGMTPSVATGAGLSHVSASKGSKTMVIQDPDNDASGHLKALRKNAEILDVWITSTDKNVSVTINVKDLTKPIRKSFGLSAKVSGHFVEWGASAAIDPLTTPVEYYFLVDEASRPTRGGRANCNNKASGSLNFKADTVTVIVPKSCFPAGKKMTKLRLFTVAYSANYNRESSDSTPGARFTFRP